MKCAKLAVSLIVMFIFCAKAIHAQKKDSFLEQRIQERKALLNGKAYKNRASKEVGPVAKRSKSTGNYQMQYTARNTGDNELSSFHTSNAFVDSQGRYYIQSSYSGNYAVDILDDGIWSHLDIGEELEARVHTFSEDEEGNIWVGTDIGLQKFNSNLASENTILFNTEDMLSDRVGNIEFDGNGNQWIYRRPYITEEWNGAGYDTTNYIGLITIFDPATGNVIAQADTIETGLEANIAEKGVRDFTVDGEGKIWAATSSGIAVYASDFSSGTRYTTENNDIPTNNIIGLETDQNGDVWVAFHDSEQPVVAHFDGANWTTYDDSDIPSGYCGSLTFASANQLYCGGSPVYVYDGMSWSKVSGITDKGETLDGAGNISSNQNGVEIFNYNPGVFIKEGKHWEFISSYTDHGLPENMVFGVSTDSDGGLWATGFMGTTYFDGTTWTYYDESDGLSDRYSWKVHVASNGTVWFGTTDDAVNYYKNGDFTIIDEYRGYYGESIYEDRDGNIWMGSFSSVSTYENTTYSSSPGILRYDGTDYTLFPRDSSTVGNINLDFSQGPDDMIYATSIGNYSDLGYYFQHLIRYDGQKWSTWLPDSSIAQVGYSKLASDKDHNLWFIAVDTSGVSKLRKWDGNKLSSYSMPEACGSRTEAMEADAEGNIWIMCGRTLSILKIPDESWITHKLSNGVIYDINHAGNGTTWVGTQGGGIYKFDTQRAVPVEETAMNTPEHFKLKQNYPNPFNPTTTIGYDLPANSRVTLKVYDLLGREVVTLVNNRRQTAGQHRISFDASSLASGMYIYRLESSSFTATRKMMLVK